MAISVFIDGGAGTTGLEIADRLAGRNEFSLIRLDDDRRKDPAARAEAANEADFMILCLPDEGVKDAVAMVRNDRTRIIDASSVHRTDPQFVYGFPELNAGQRKAISSANRVSNPGCYPTGFLALIAPLVAAKLLPADWPYSVNAISGYSGGGKGLIERFETAGSIAYRGYGYSLSHKHLPEMQVHGGLAHAPLFAPSVVNAFRGMVVEVPLPLVCMSGAASPDTLRQFLAGHYETSPLIHVHDGSAPDEILLHQGQDGSDRMDLYVLPSADGAQARLIATLDNLGKGASGAAVQNLNIMAGLDEIAGLRL